MAFVGRDRSHGDTCAAENEAVDHSEPVSEASSEIVLAERTESDDPGSHIDGVPDLLALSGVDEPVAHGSAIPDCFAPCGPGEMWHLSLVQSAEMLSALMGSTSGRDLHLIGSCYCGKALGLTVVGCTHQFGH